MCLHLIYSSFSDGHEMNSFVKLAENYNMPILERNICCVVKLEKAHKINANYVVALFISIILY